MKRIIKLEKEFKRLRRLKRTDVGEAFSLTWLLIIRPIVAGFVQTQQSLIC